MRRLCCLLAVLLCASPGALLAQPADAPIIPLDDLKPGQHGVVWTVFRGSEPEPFSVEVTGVLRNTLGPGKSLILCQLTDPRVQNMGAVAGMSGSPLYIDGKLAGALSYQIQRFETVRYAGFTPAADLVEVKERAALQSTNLAALDANRTSPSQSPYQAIQPVFTIGGLSPAVADLFAPRFAALGLSTFALGGSTQSGGTASAEPAKATLNSQPVDLQSVASTMRPGSAVSVALATGDVTLAGTGTVSRVDGNRITAFGHPMLSLGDVDLPMCSAEIVTILPSQMQSMKVANTGAVIGTITQDRLSAISGTLGAGPAMIDVDVKLDLHKGAARSLHFSVVRHQQLTPTLVAAGVTQAILGSNDAGLANGFKLSSDVRFSPVQSLAFQTLYSGPQGFAQGLNEFVQGLAANLQNPYEKTFPDRVAFTVEPLDDNPAVTLDLFQLSRTSARGGDTVQATVAWRDFQGEAHRETIDLPIDSAWTGKQLEVILAPGRAMDELTGRPRVIAASELRSFDAYLAAMRDDRPSDGVCVAVVEKAALFSDQTVATPDAPGSIERIARGADESRFHKRDAVLPLWEKHLLDGKLFNTVVRRPLNVVD
ncbi:MAG TPA: SpoIVB peptidase S55 domain-containing protein [Opitutaceae bacterium]|nr:SpoIVB peptidase S55 domain-containing protein [Opitutaceae bacterium]